LGYLLMLLLLVHAGAALRHHFVSKDDTLRRMLL
jgi:cytochrome b561